MSEHAAFCTEYIFCDQCFEAAKSVLLAKHKFHCSTVLPGFPSRDKHGDETDKIVPVPIIAGKLGASGAGGEVYEMAQLISELEQVICHPMQVALMCENGTNAFFKAEARGMSYSKNSPPTAHPHASNGTIN